MTFTFSSESMSPHTVGVRRTNGPDPARQRRLVHAEGL